MEKAIIAPKMAIIESEISCATIISIFKILNKINIIKIPKIRRPEKINSLSKIYIIVTESHMAFKIK